MRSILLPAMTTILPVRGLPLAFVGIAFSGILLFSGCGRSEEKPGDDAQESPTPSPIVDSLQDAPEPLPTPSLSPSPQATATQATATAPKTLYVVTAFEAVSDRGTHQFPVGAQVNVMEVDGEDFLVEYNGVAVRNGQEFFSETMVTESVAAEPVPPAATPAPESSPAPEEQAWPAATGTPDPRMGAEEEKSAELLGEIRSINHEIRQAEDAQKLTTGSDTEVKDSSEIKSLKKRRDALSEDLTDFAKP